MNDPRSPLARLRDARRYAAEARQIATSQLSGLDARASQAVRYCLMVVGEALAAVPAEALVSESSIPWRRVIGLRHRLVHGYWLIDEDLIFDMARDETEALIAALDRLIGTTE